jgi:hypothetical protein
LISGCATAVNDIGVGHGSSLRPAS